VRLDRPCAAAVWAPRLPVAEWAAAHAVFSREGGNHWVFQQRVPEHWPVAVGDLAFLVGPTDFGHVGVFPEHAVCWRWMEKRIVAWNTQNGAARLRLLNLFAYTGGASLAAARVGAEVCHLDASPKSVAWARENAALNGLQDAPMRWIVDDVHKFLRREKRRDSRHTAIIVDPPSFGRGRRDEVFKIDTHLRELLSLCRDVLVEAPDFVILTCHTPGYTPLVLRNVLAQAMAGLAGRVEEQEMVLPCAADGFSIPSGACAMWAASG
jgi:23S rRNA (cytosine1962-C5)-methyltransferase